ncbi:hypothetical protein EJ05DRAFT_127131 [Pseudovirgaria hyperparasitica]|uniref:SH3 domain-containing protein n=1 Tax=Pseudovirgaria hyperparasitica TaxID=470096 RepID=A0A6A6VX33_9PEZI|nr:uncharacterized protein EJ05DRAFT_127131 [Pseudovirgaria hyperparasitica]KAF2755238.1 hypothetical protein EJ05DRAFT_127131 [Pseudovirgaria hyperparasitica]
MAAVMSNTNTNPTSSPSARSTPSNSGIPPLPPIVTTNSSARLQRASSYAKNRLSTYSTSSNPQRGSRPQSTVFPVFHSSLPYTLVRDFAYGPTHPLFYGPLPDGPSEISTPASEFNRRLSDPQLSYESLRGGWPIPPLETGERLPQTSFDNGQDGPPWSEDEDIQSPVVHGPREIATQLAEDMEQTLDSATVRRDSHFPKTLPRRAYGSDDEDMSDTSSNADIRDENRYSRDYQFTIADPDEEMAGKAVALFDFARENDNELPLIEGQVILVSYRHGQGWLVAQDPKSGESGLVPEEYVRLLRDIEGGWNGLMNGQVTAQDTLLSPISAGPEAKTPTQAEHRDDSASNGVFYTPVVSTFSTSSKDFHPYPQHLRESQQSTPTMTDEDQFKRHQDDLVRSHHETDEKSAVNDSPR